MGKSKQQRGSAYKRNNNKKYGPDPNKPDEDIVNESIHLLNMELDKLIANKEMPKKDPRPQNVFVLYKKNRLAGSEYKNRPKKDRKIKLTSKEIANCWHNETDQVKKVYFALQRMAEKKHKEIYKTRKVKNQPKTQKTAAEDASHSFEIFPESIHASRSPANSTISSNLESTGLSLVQDSISPLYEFTHPYCLQDNDLVNGTSQFSTDIIPPPYPLQFSTDFIPLLYPLQFSTNLTDFIRYELSYQDNNSVNDTSADYISYSEEFQQPFIYDNSIISSIYNAQYVYNQESEDVNNFNSSYYIHYSSDSEQSSGQDDYFDYFL